ncbi:MAG: Crp/Fnr family transcriptional regulator, partial [Planctomycetota bacterium]
DVSADAPRMQRTLLELHYVPAAYVPAMVFHDVERLDIMRMVRLLVPPDLGEVHLVPEGEAIADAVMHNVHTRSVLPEIAAVLPRVGLFRDLADEQRRRVASLCRVRRFASGEVLIEEGRNDGRTYLLLDGEVDVLAGAARRAVGRVSAGEALGEMSLLSSTPYSATARARGEVVAAELTHEDLDHLVRQRPDIAVVIYRAFANEIGDKLRRTTARLAGEGGDGKAATGEVS